MKPALSFLLLPYLFLAQPAAPRRVFESAEVHMSAAGVREAGGFLPDGRFECQGTTLLKLIATAYNVNTDFIVGGPDWLGSDGFDITARAASRRASPEALRGMLQSLLADRLALDVHNEQKEMPVYLLTVAKKGLKLRPAANGTAPECPAAEGAVGLNHRACQGYTMTDLSKLLPQIAWNYIDRPVVNMTGIARAYDFHLDWMGKAAYVAAKANPEGPPALSIFDALEKLGLTLEPGTRPSAVVVIDHVNRMPAADPGGTERNIPAIPTEFEAADIRPGKPGAPGSLTAQNGRLEIRGFTLRKLITMALDAKDDLVTGGPKWLDVDRFDVVAKSAEVMSPHAMAGMLKTLIVERFKLEIHNEEQPVPVFALVLGKHEPKLKESSGSSHSECKSKLGEAGITCVCQNTTLAQLAERLPDIAGAYLIHPMVDLTGLQGAYDFSMTWTPRSRLPDVTGRPVGGMVQAAAPGGLTVFEAIDQQLGLKLEERKHPMQVIVIDHVERTPVEVP